MIKYGCDNGGDPVIHWCQGCWAQCVCNKCGIWAAKGRWGCTAAEAKATNDGWFCRLLKIHLCPSCIKKTTVAELMRM